MEKYKVVCLDMFQTLVDISARSRVIWQRILGQDFSEDLWLDYSKEVSGKIVHNFHEEESLKTFRTLRQIFESSFKEIFCNLGVRYCPVDASQIFIEEHNLAGWYHDSLAFIEHIKGDYHVCLVSDADYDMVKDLIKIADFDKVVISEEIKSYKKHPDGRMFKAILDEYKCQACEVLHIGDSSSDMIGAARQGLDTCWINRHNYTKAFDIKPTYEVVSLQALEGVLLTKEGANHE